MESIDSPEPMVYQKLAWLVLRTRAQPTQGVSPEPMASPAGWSPAFEELEGQRLGVFSQPRYAIVLCVRKGAAPFQGWVGKLEVNFGVNVTNS